MLVRIEGDIRSLQHIQHTLREYEENVNNCGESGRSLNIVIQW